MSQAGSIGVISSPQDRVGQNLMGTLNGLELGVEFLLVAWVAIRVILEG